MKIGDLIKFTHMFEPEQNDFGVVTNIQGRDVRLEWAKTGAGYSTIDRLLCEKRYFKIIENNIINDNNQCLFNTISIDQQQIFLNFFDELVSNKNKLFESSINESTDANEKKMIKSKLDILTKESLGLEFKKI